MAIVSGLVRSLVNSAACLAIGVAAICPRASLSAEPASSSRKILLVYQVDEKKTEWRPNKMDSLANALRNRLNRSLGKEVAVRRLGTNQVEIVLPGLDGKTPQARQAEVERIKFLIRTTGKLEFRIVANRLFNATLIEKSAAARKAACRKTPGSDDARIVRDSKGKESAKWCRVRGNEEASLKNDDAAIEVNDGSDANGDIASHHELLVLAPDNDACDVTGNYLRSARVEQHPETAGWQLLLTFNAEGGAKLGRLTESCLPTDNGEHKSKLAVVLDDVVLTAPVVQSKITDKACITGQFTKSQHDNLCDVLGAGSLPAALDPTPVREALVDDKAPSESSK